MSSIIHEKEGVRYLEGGGAINAGNTVLIIHTLLNNEYAHCPL